MQASSHCRTCKAPVRWVRTMQGKNMPLDPDPVADGNVWIDHWEAGTPVVGVGLTRDDVPRSEPCAYVSHFVTCVNADEWRKRGKKNE